MGKNVTIKAGVMFGENIVIEDDVFIDYNCIIRDNVTLKKGTMVGANCILGEYQMDFFKTRNTGEHPLVIGENSIIRSGTIIYGDTIIGNGFQTGHNVTIREKAQIGNHVSVGTLTDIQGDCIIGNYVRAHSNVFIAEKTVIEDCVWIFPHTVITNDPTPPSEWMMGVHIQSYAIVAAGAILLPGITIEGDTLVAAGAVVTKDVKKNSIVGGNPAKVISDISEVKNRFTGERVYPWRYTFKRAMPWAESDYDAWYAQIEKQLKEQ